MPDEEQVLRAFTSMRDVLRDSGLLILTQGTTDRQWREKPRFIPAINTSDFTRVFVIDYLDQGARYNILDIVHDERTCDFQVWSVEYSYILLRDDYDRLLKKAGFGNVNAYGTYRFDPYDEETAHRLITVARR